MARLQRKAPAVAQMYHWDARGGRSVLDNCSGDELGILLVQLVTKFVAACSTQMVCLPWPLAECIVLLQAGKLRRTMIDADARKLQNVIKHSKPGSVKVKPARQKKIVGQEE